MKSVLVFVGELVLTTLAVQTAARLYNQWRTPR